MQKHLPSLIYKRSIILDGHKTSISLEDDFWNELKKIAVLTNRSMTDLVAGIDRKRTHTNLSSALRLFVLAHYTGELKRAR